MAIAVLDLDGLLVKAVKLAVQAHSGQLDKAGKPYIDHPLRVMNAVSATEEKIVAVLHDTIEDTDLTIEKLQSEGFPENILNALIVLTKKKGDDYSEYIERVKQNAIALRVKIADMADNMDRSRIENPTEKDLKRFEKYQAIFPTLMEALE